MSNNTSIIFFLNHTYYIGVCQGCDMQSQKAPVAVKLCCQNSRGRNSTEPEWIQSAVRGATTQLQYIQLLLLDATKVRTLVCTKETQRRGSSQAQCYAQAVLLYSSVCLCMYRYTQYIILIGKKYIYQSYCWTVPSMHVVHSSYLVICQIRRLVSGQK